MNVLFARENARVLNEAVASYEAHLKDARNRQDLGLAASNETLAVTVEREQAELARLQAENGAAVAMANLLRLVGLPAGTAVDLDPAPPASAQAADDSEELVKRATLGRPELEALRARVRALDATQEVARSASRPQAGLEAGFDYTNPNLRFVPWEARLEVHLEHRRRGELESARRGAFQRLGRPGPGPGRRAARSAFGS